MKKLHYFFAFMALCLGSKAFSQPLQYTQVPEYLNANAYWAYYNHIGLDWSGGKPVYDSTALSSWDARNMNLGFNGYNVLDETGAVSVSDPHTGKLLFYTNGGTIWNRNHEVTPNGDAIRFVNTRSSSLREDHDPTNDQGTCIVPFPGDSNKFYVFTIDGPVLSSTGHQLHYSIVDMTLDGGKGDIVGGMKNVPLLYKHTNRSFDSLDYQKRYTSNKQAYWDFLNFQHSLTAIPGNNCDIWLLTYVFKNNESTLDTLGREIQSYDGANIRKDAQYYAFHITENGIDTVPVISNSLLHHMAGVGNTKFTVSPDRTRILYASQDLMFKNVDPMLFGITGTINFPMNNSELSRFDPNTGKVSDPVPFDYYEKRTDFNPLGIGTDFFNVASAAFSPDNKKLYTVNANYSTSEVYLYQFDISHMDSSAIASSRYTVDSFVAYFTSGACFGVNSLTLRPYKDTIYAIWGFQPKIGSINNPDGAGSECGFQLDYFTLPVDKPNGGNTFSEVVYPYHVENAFVAEYNTCKEQVLQPRFGNDKTYFRWSDGSTGATLAAHRSGVYWVSYSFFQDNCIHLYTDTFKVVSQGFEELPLVTVKIDTLGTVQTYAAYQWLYEGEAIPGATGRYHVALKNGDYRVVATNDEGCRDTSDVYAITSLTHIHTIGGVTIAVYPNPATDLVYIQSNQPLSYRLFDMSGREIIGRQYSTTVDVRQLAAGIYQLQLFDDKGLNLGNWRLSKQ